MKVTTKQLGRCNARIKTLEETDLYIEYVSTSGLVFEHHCDCDSFDVKLLESYNSIVAVMITDSEGYQELYYLPRHNYSITTQQHVAKFARETSSFGYQVSMQAISFRIGIEAKRSW